MNCWNIMRICLAVGCTMVAGEVSAQNATFCFEEVEIKKMSPFYEIELRAPVSGKYSLPAGGYKPKKKSIYLQLTTPELLQTHQFAAALFDTKYPGLAFFEQFRTKFGTVFDNGVAKVESSTETGGRQLGAFDEQKTVSDGKSFLKAYFALVLEVVRHNHKAWPIDSKRVDTSQIFLSSPTRNGLTFLGSDFYQLLSISIFELATEVLATNIQASNGFGDDLAQSTAISRLELFTHSMGERLDLLSDFHHICEVCFYRFFPNLNNRIVFEDTTIGLKTGDNGISYALPKDSIEKRLLNRLEDSLRIEQPFSFEYMQPKIFIFKFNGDSELANSKIRDGLDSSALERIVGEFWHSANNPNSIDLQVDASDLQVVAALSPSPLSSKDYFVLRDVGNRLAREFGNILSARIDIPTLDGNYQAYFIWEDNASCPL